MILEQEIKIEFICDCCHKRCIHYPDKLKDIDEQVMCHQCGTWNTITEIIGVEKEASGGR